MNLAKKNHRYIQGVSLNTCTWTSTQQEIKMEYRIVADIFLETLYLELV